MFQMFLGMILDNLEDSFDFVEECISVACAHEVKNDESVVKYKWQNPHAD